MNIAIKSTNIELTEALQDYTEKRLSGIAKFAGGEAMVRVEIGKTTGHHKHGDVFVAEVNVTTALGRQYRAVSEKNDLYEAIDDVRGEIINTLSGDKDRSQTLFRRGAAKIKNMLKGFK